MIIAATPPAAGYELSIYGVYPDVLWVLISVNIFFSIYTILRSGDDHAGNLYYGYFSLLVIETILFFLPVIRGYYSMSRGGGDMYHHMFVASQILHSGYFPQTDFYPIMHVWLSIVYNYLPDFIVLMLIISVIFYMLYILSLYCLGKTMLGTKTGGIFLSIFGIPLIFSFLHWSFIPFFFALIIFPLVLYAYQEIKNNPPQKGSFYICLIFLSLFIVFCHPMISVVLIIMFSIFTFFEVLKRWRAKGQANIESANIVLIVSLTLVLWWLQFISILNTLQRISVALLGEASRTSIIDHQMDVISKSNVSFWTVVDIFIKTYGPVFLYFLISMVFTLYIIYHYYQNKKIVEDDFIYSIQFFAALVMGVVLMTGYFVIFEPIRAAMFGLIFASILGGLFFYRVWVSLSEKRKPGLTISITLIMTLVCILTMFALYSSPWLSVPNTALTYGDKIGNDWILEYRNAKIPIVREDGSLYPYSKFYYESTNATRNGQPFVQYPRIIPSGFGYTTNRTMGDTFSMLRDKNVYLITTKKMELAPYAVSVERRSRSEWFTDSDFIRLKQDRTVNLVYSGNEFGVWNIAIPKV